MVDRVEFNLERLTFSRGQMWRRILIIFNSSWKKYSWIVGWCVLVREENATLVRKFFSFSLFLLQFEYGVTSRGQIYDEEVNHF